jgi:hypothetical protein
MQIRRINLVVDLAKAGLESHKININLRMIHPPEPSQGISTAPPAADEESDSTSPSNPSSDKMRENSAFFSKDNTHSLAALWARKYVNSVLTDETGDSRSPVEDLTELSSSRGRHRTATKLNQHLSQASALGWSSTEELLATELPRHRIDPNLIDPWQIAADSHQLFRKALDAYANAVTPQRLSVIVGTELGRVRQKYTETDPRVIGFVSMQFHYTGKHLLEKLSPAERSLMAPYLKVLDDHLYMPLRDAYEAAANHALTSPVLLAVQHFLPISTEIAHAVCDQICQVYPNYRSYSGKLTSPEVRISSIRDVEMFQVYLCVCVLEDSVRLVQRELFPLCVMLYPQLKVSWKLVQEMLQTLRWEMHDRLKPEDMAVFLPYLHMLMDMFSPEVFQTA